MKRSIANAVLCGAFILTFSLCASSLPSHSPWLLASAVAAERAGTEKEAFEAAKELGTVEAWDAFLSNYPSGFHADLARAYVKKLAAPDVPEAAKTAPARPPAREVSTARAFAVRCADRANFRSENSSERATIRFVNNSGTTLVIQWVDFSGALKEYGVLQPGAEMTQDTFISHPWIAAWQEGSCRQMFLPAGGSSIAELLPDAQLQPTAATGPPVRKKPSQRSDKQDDHGPTPVQTCANVGMDYDGISCVPRRKQKTVSKATIERRAARACVEMGMIYLNGKCAPRLKAERKRGEQNKNKPCPKGMYRNPYGQCQPNQTGG